MIWSVSWRNIWRNKTRSLVIIVAIALGIMAGIFATAFMAGMTTQRVETAIATEISHIQVHHPKFREVFDKQYTITSDEEIINKISSIEGVASVSRRLILNSFISSAKGSGGVQIMGVNPEIEMKTTDLYTEIVEGDYFETKRKNSIVIGKKLAEKLKVKLRSKVVVTIQDESGNMSKAMFRVVGIFKTANAPYDEGKVFVKASDLERVSGLDPNRSHQIAIRLSDNDLLDEVADEVKAIYPNAEVKKWGELRADLNYMAEMMDMYMFIFVGIILLALGFGIVNTMLMVVLERVKEIGMLMAVGMSKMRIFFMIVFETVMLSLTGGVLGIFIGSLISLYFSKNAINLSSFGEGLEEFGMESLVYTEINLFMIVGVTIMVILAGVLAAIYPARKALKYKPVEALRTD